MPIAVRWVDTPLPREGPNYPRLGQTLSCSHVNNFITTALPHKILPWLFVRYK